MAGTYRCSCTDWTIDDDAPGVLRFVPSSKTVTQSMTLSGVLLALAMVLAIMLGFPPGCRNVSKARDKLQQLESKLDRAEDTLQRVSTGVTARDPGSVGQAVVQNARTHVELLRAEVQKQQAVVDRTTATLGPVGDTLYWLGMGALVLGSLAVPWIASRERITLEFTADTRTLHVRRKGQIIRSRSFDLHHYDLLGVHVRRVFVGNSRQHHVEDHGWVWSVLLLSSNDRQTVVELDIDKEFMLPQPFDKLTSRVRRVLRFMVEHTGLPTGPPVKSDIDRIDAGFMRSGVTIRSVQGSAPASHEPTYREL